MCVVSMIGDHYHDKWKDKDWTNIPHVPPAGYYQTVPPISRDEFELLRKEVCEMKELLTRALEYDRRTNQPNCEKEEKLEVLKKVAQLVGVDLNDIFPQKSGKE